MSKRFIILLTGAAVIWLVGKMVIQIYTSSVNASSSSYIQSVVPLIISSWSKEELISNASKELKKNTSNGKLNDIFLRCSQLKGLEKFTDIHGNIVINFSIRTGVSSRAIYTGTAFFKNAPARVTIMLVQENGGWKINSFNVDSSIFSQRDYR